MTLVKFNPEKKNGSLLPGFNDIFESILGETLLTDRRINSLPAVNIHESSEGYHIELAAPGLKKEDFRISLERDMLTISSEQSDQKIAHDKNYNRREFSYGSFTRMFNLPDGANVDHISARYTDGILHLDLPKREEAKAITRQIEIK